jgi:hypothetical protein
MGRARHGVAIATEHVSGMVVGEDIDQVGPAIGGAQSLRRGGRRHQFTPGQAKITHEKSFC